MLPSVTSMLPLTALVWPALALIGVLALILIAQRAARLSLLQRRPGGARLAVLEAVPIDTRRRLHLVRCGERNVLLLTGGAQDLVVGWLHETLP